MIKFTWATGGALTLILLIGWPILALPAKVFSEGYFTFWVIIAMVWGIVASVVCICLPIIEASDIFVAIFSGKKYNVPATSADASAHAEGKGTHLELPPAPAVRA